MKIWTGRATPSPRPLASLVLLLCGFALGETLYGTLKPKKLIRVIDGDTFIVSLADYSKSTSIPRVFGDSIHVRVYGIDTPELHSHDSLARAEAQQARRFTDSVLAHAKRITLLNVRRDKYFRILAEVKADTLNLGPALIARHLAKPYFGGTKNP